MSLLYKLALPKIKGVGHKAAKELLTYFGSAEKIFNQSKKELTRVAGIGATTADHILDAKILRDAEDELKFIEKHNIEPLFWNEENYPKRLEHCADAPVMLFYKGKNNLNQKRIVSVVGTRNATHYGKKICAELIEVLQQYDVLVVSGLAYGIDSFAHQSCVDLNVQTVGVLGHGLDRIYPAANRSLAARMLEHGGLLTEYRSNTRPDRQNFPARNRIIAGLADVTIVVEAAIKGGALITAEIANTYNRDVCAFPGNVNNEFSKGCNHLIKTHRANLISNGKDLEYVMGWEKAGIHTVESPQMAIGLNALEQTIYDAIVQNGQLSIDDLGIKLNVQQSKLAIGVLALEMKGVIVSLPGKIYRVL